MATPTNVLQQVQTYQMANLSFLLNRFCAIHNANKKFKDFQNFSGQLGQTVTFELPPRFLTGNSLVVNFQGSEQRVMPLTVSQQASIGYAFNVQQFIYNVQDYMERFGKSATITLGSKIEGDILLNTVSGVTNQLTGSLNSSSGPYRFYGDGVNPINSYGQLAQALANFRDYGAAPMSTKGFLPMTLVPAIVNTGLNQFVKERNEDIAFSWALGRFSDCEWFESNLLPTHTAGNVGNLAQTLTLVSTNDPTGQNVTQLTFSGATASDADAIFSGDLLQFQDGVSGQPNMRYLTFTGYTTSNQPVQFRATANAGATGGGQVTINVTPALVWANNSNQNLNNPLAAGMQVKALPTHRAGLIYSGDALFIGMPQLPEEVPYPTANMVDKDSGASIRNYYGSQFAANNRGYVHDAIWGSALVPEYTMRLIFPA